MVPQGSALSGSLPRLLWLSWSETRGCLQGNWEKNEPGPGRSSKKDMRSRVGSTWLTVGSWTSHLFPGSPRTHPWTRLQSETTLGPCCFSESPKPADHGCGWRGA